MRNQHISELTGAALDWAVAKCEPDDTIRIYFDGGTGEKLCRDDWDIPEFRPSTDWGQGGLIIEREKISVWARDNEWAAESFVPNQHGLECVGSTPLIAAMRCYVASKLGDNIELPTDCEEV